MIEGSCDISEVDIHLCRGCAIAAPESLASCRCRCRRTRTEVPLAAIAVTNRRHEVRLVFWLFAGCTEGRVGQPIEIKTSGFLCHHCS